MAKKIVVTGGKGFIGSKLAAVFKNPIIIDNIGGGFDIRWSNLKRYFRDADTVFHLAALTSLPECQSNPKLAYGINVTGTVNVLEAARLNDVRRVVFSSSSAVYEGTCASPPSTEREALYPRLIYPATKVAAEQACRAYSNAYGMDIVILRYCNVYGFGANSTRQNPAYFIYLINQLMDDKRPHIYANKYSKRDYVYVDDVVDVNKLVMNAPRARNQIFNITTEECLTARQILKIINNELGTNIKPIESKGYWSNYPVLYEGKKILDSTIAYEVNKLCHSNRSHIHNLLGWKPKISFKQGIAKIIKEMDK